jgi:hypothetical protein
MLLNEKIPGVCESVTAQGTVLPTLEHSLGDGLGTLRITGS